MLPDGAKLERLLEKLFEDDEESGLEDIVVLKKPIRPLETHSDCCSYNYSAYA
jgi:hypothetical protein